MAKEEQKCLYVYILLPGENTPRELCIRPKKGETYADLYARALETALELLDRHDDENKGAA